MSSESRDIIREALTSRGIDLATEAEAAGFEDVDAFLNDVATGGGASRPAMQGMIERIATSADFQDADQKRQNERDQLMRRIDENLNGVREAVTSGGGMNVNVVSFTANLQFAPPPDEGNR